MQSLQEILVKSQGDKKILAKYFTYRQKHGSQSVPKACLTEEAVQLLCRWFRNKHHDDVEISTVVTVILCLLEFAASDKDKQSWLKLSNDVYWLLDKCLVFMYSTTQENTNELLGKFLPALSMICENGDPLSTMIFSRMTRPLIALSLREAMPKDRQASILDTIEQVLLKSDKSVVCTTLSKIGLYMNALSSLVFKVSVETQLSILTLLSHAAHNKDDAVRNAQRWFALHPKIQRALLQIYSEPYCEASGEFLSAMYEVINSTSRKPEITHTAYLASKNMKSSVCPTENNSNIHSKNKDRHDMKSEHSVRGKMSCSGRTIIPHEPFVRLQESAGGKYMPGKCIPANQSKLLPTASKLKSIKILGESVSKIETHDSQKTVSTTSNVDQKFQYYKVPAVNEDVLPVPIERQVSISSDNQQARTIRELYRKNLLSTPYYPNRQRSLSLKRTQTVQHSGIKLKSSSTLEDEVIHEKQIKSLQHEFRKEEKKSESQRNQHQAPPQKQKENEQKCEGRNLKHGNTLTQEHESKQIKETGRCEQRERQLVQERKEQSSRNQEMMNNRSNVMKLNKPQKLSNQCSLIDLESDLDGMERIKSWIETSTLYSQSIDEDEIIVLNESNSALSKPEENRRKKTESERISEGKKSSPTRPDETFRKHRKCDQLDVAVQNKPKERQVNIISSTEKMDKSTTGRLLFVGTTKVSCVGNCSDNSTNFRKPEGRAFRNHTSNVSNREFIKQSHEINYNTLNKNPVQKQIYDTESNHVEKNVTESIQNKDQNMKVFHERASPECVRKKFQNLEGNEDCSIEDKKLQDFQLKAINPLNVIHSKNTKYGIESKPNPATEVKETKGVEIPSCTAKVFPKRGKKRLFTKSSTYDDWDASSQISAKREKGQHRFFLVKDQAIQVKRESYQPVVRPTKSKWELRLQELDRRATGSKVDDVYVFHEEPNPNGKGIKNKVISSKKKKESYYTNDLKRDHKKTLNLCQKSRFNVDRKRSVPINRNLVSNTESKEVVEQIHSGDSVKKPTSSSSFDTNNKGRSTINHKYLHVKSPLKVPQKQSKPQRNVPRPNYTELSDDSFKSSAQLNVHCQEDEGPPVIVTEENSLLSKEKPCGEFDGTNKGSNSGKVTCEKKDACAKTPCEKEFAKPWERKQHGMKVQDRTMERNRTLSAKDLDSGVDVASTISDDIVIERRNVTQTANLNSCVTFDHMFRTKLQNEQLCTNIGSQSLVLQNMESLVDQLKQSVETAKCLAKTDEDIIREQKLCLEDCISMLLGSNKANTL